MAIFTGLSAFPPTPANDEGIVNVDALATSVERLANAGVDSITVLGSTGAYAYLDRDQRTRAVSAAVEAAANRVPIVAGVGALRTSWAKGLAVSAEAAGASGLLLAPMSYVKLNDREVADHFRTVATSTTLPLCIYNNPGATNFNFSHDLVAELAGVPHVVAAKLPPLNDDNYADEIERLRKLTSACFKIGFTGDWCAAPALLAGADTWHSAIAGILPEPAVRLTKAALGGDIEEATKLQNSFEPMCALFKKYGGLRIIYGIAEILSVDVGTAPLPVQACIGDNWDHEIRAALDYLFTNHDLLE